MLGCVTARAPAHTRAWIETSRADRRQRGGVWRPLTRGRGLKLSGHEKTIANQRGARSHAGVD